MKTQDKIVPFRNLAQWRENLKQQGKKLVVTNGCFDLLHVGHVTYLEQARSLGDVLLVGLNDDESVRKLKGSDRPINRQEERAYIMAALQSVDAVSIFNGRTATVFLEAVEPDVWVKGGDYTLDSLDYTEKAAVFRSGGRIVIIPLVPGKSTTGTLAKLAS